VKIFNFVCKTVTCLDSHAPYKSVDDDKDDDDDREGGDGGEGGE